MKTKIKSLLLEMLRLARSESGELLSVRRKARLLDAAPATKAAAIQAVVTRRPTPEAAPVQNSPGIDSAPVTA